MSRVQMNLPENKSTLDISVVAPVYNEEKNIAPFLERIVPILESLGSYEIVFCLDPSSDKSGEEIESSILRNPCIRLIEFSRRFGQPAAVIAGIRHSQGKACVLIDVDLQDPPELIADLWQKMQEGYDVVYAKRRKREEGEAWLKLWIAKIWYRFMHFTSDVNIPKDVGDFRIISRRVVDELCRLEETHGFIRGLVAYIGFSQTFVMYDREKRSHGAGNYNRYVGSLRIGLNGLVGYSSFLLTATLLVGFFIVMCTFLLAFILGILVITGTAYPRGLPISVLILFIGGIQLVSVGVLGQYVGRIYDEVKKRPQYIISRKINMAETSE